MHNDSMPKLKSIVILFSVCLIGKYGIIRPDHGSWLLWINDT